MLVQSLGWEDPLEESMAPRSSIPAGESHGQSILAGCSPWGLEESDLTEATWHAGSQDRVEFEIIDYYK